MALDNLLSFQMSFPWKTSISFGLSQPAMFDFVTAQVAKQLPGLKLPNTLMFDYPSPQVRCNLDQDGVQLKKEMATP